MPVRLAVKVSPKASRNGIQGWTDSSPRELSVCVSVAPEGGKANKAVCELVAKSMGIAKSRVSVKRGETARHKQLEIDIDETSFQEWCDTIG